MKYKQGEKSLFHKEGEIMEANRKDLKRKQEKALLTFLKQTREGRYAKIDESSLPYSRLKEQREETSYDDEYYYSTS